MQRPHCWTQGRGRKKHSEGCVAGNGGQRCGHVQDKVPAKFWYRHWMWQSGDTDGGQVTKDIGAMLRIWVSIITVMGTHWVVWSTRHLDMFGFFLILRILLHILLAHGGICGQHQWVLWEDSDWRKVFGVHPILHIYILAEAGLELEALFREALWAGHTHTILF